MARRRSDSKLSRSRIMAITTAVAGARAFGYLDAALQLYVPEDEVEDAKALITALLGCEPHTYEQNESLAKSYTASHYWRGVADVGLTGRRTPEVG
jgi:hypothetical protein